MPLQPAQFAEIVHMDVTPNSLSKAASKLPTSLPVEVATKFTEYPSLCFPIPVALSTLGRACSDLKTAESVPPIPGSRSTLP